MTDNPWLVLGLLGFSAAATLVANWLVARLWRPPKPAIGNILASLVWMLLLIAAGALAVRYFERLPNTNLAVLAYLVFGLFTFALSLGRAVLYLRIQETSRATPGIDRRELLNLSVHNATYLLFALCVYLGLSWLLRRPVQPLLFLPLAIGALLPDLDSADSALGRLLPFLSRRLEARLGHLQVWHTPAAAAFLALLTAPLIPLVGVDAWLPMTLGFLCHLVVDMLSPQGAMLAWPSRRTRYALFGAPVQAPGRTSERMLVAGLAIAAAVLLVAVDWGPPPQPPAPPPLTYEQTLDRYRSFQGRYLAVAQVEGVWQATGRRVSARFEILNAAGSSFILRDSYTGRVFTAGRAVGDNLYLHRVTLGTGDAVRVKATEVEVHDQRLGEAFPVLYEMQKEPGLQHIYVSGDALIAPGETGLQVDYTQTQVRRIELLEAGHYRLRYLTAAELIELANVRAEIANLVIIATYISPPAGPTATPLPSPPPELEAMP